jgi:hypothetical protein
LDFKGPTAVTVHTYTGHLNGTQAVNLLLERSMGAA